MKSAVVTGTSTGIGVGIVSELLKAGWEVFGSVRSEADAVAVQERYGAHFHPLVFDTTDEAAVLAAAGHVERILAGRVLDGLVNNAGVALSDPLLVQSTADFRHQLEVNLIGPFIVTKAFAQLMGVKSDASPTKGRIVNISSVGGRISPPFLGAYAASKHGLEGMSASLRRELLIFGVDVIVVGPGSVATPIWDKAQQIETDRLDDTAWATSYGKFVDAMILEGRKGLAPDEIGRVVVEALAAAKPRTRYAPVAGKFVNWTLPLLLPDRLLDWLVGRRMGVSIS